MESKKKQVKVRVARDSSAKGMAEADVMRNQSTNGVLSDVLGSYTGTPADGEMPEQDPDDI
jgi:hypothetical protein